MLLVVSLQDWGTVVAENFGSHKFSAHYTREADG
jgi:hypothetical protein